MKYDKMYKMACSNGRSVGNMLTNADVATKEVKKDEVLSQRKSVSNI